MRAMNVREWRTIVNCYVLTLLCFASSQLADSLKNGLDVDGEGPGNNGA